MGSPKREFSAEMAVLGLVVAVSGLAALLVSGGWRSPASLDEARGRLEWMGTYQAGFKTGTAYSLSLAAGGTATRMRFGRTASSMISKGQYHLDATARMLFLSTLEGDGRWQRFHLIPWGPRHYVVHERDLLNFCNSVNLGFEPRTATAGNQYLREGEERLSATGLPEVPEESRAFLLAEPVTGQISSAGSPAKVTLWLNRPELVRPGMQLSATRGRGGPRYLIEVTAVRAPEVTAKRVLPTDPEPRSGDPVSSRQL